MLQSFGTCAALGALLLGGVACTGDLLGGNPGSDPSSPDPNGLTGGTPGAGGSVGPQVTGSGDPPPPTVLRRLTNTEYNNTVRDLLSTSARPGAAFLVDEVKLGFDNIAEIQTTSPVRAEQYMMAAEDLAAEAKTALLAGLPCAAAADAVCASQLIRDLGAKVYRRPLSEAEVTRLQGVYQVGHQNGGFERGVELALRTMLISPSFLFRIEVGETTPEKPAAKRPTSWEMASRLSYTLLGTLPDAALFQAAAENALVTREQILAQTERLLGDPRAKTNIQHLHEQWFELTSIDPVKLHKDRELFPRFTEEVLLLTRRETETFLDDAVWNAPNGAAAMLTGSYSFMNAKLAEFYGVTGPMGEAFERVDLDPARRAGILTHASLLARYAHDRQTSPTLRGKFVRQRLLCMEIPPPPPAVDANPVPAGPTSTARERVAQHLTDPTCTGCHSLLDPIGLGFEHYDATGAWQDQEGGKIIDVTGNIAAVTFTPPADGNFNGVPELAAELAASEEARSCLTKHWFRFAYGREETEHDAAVLASLNAALNASGGNLRQLLLDLTQTDAFLYRGRETP